MAESIDGISEACLALETPVISGNVSMYNTSKGGAILPMPIIGMVGLVENTKYVTPSHFQIVETLFTQLVKYSLSLVAVNCKM
ncbi:AIR synthase related protein [Niallia sp. XMNu-256]|uniref:hypothetical protein n=1 Tax=Niallia sp. XMNu-256 TaxID=3082444 RepID=UPI0030D4B896